jgi:antitoxin component of RelBE/YafQ-DinJ toxin-antitoxin module
MKKEILQIRIEKKEKEILKKICKENSISISALIRFYIRQIIINKDPFWYKK